MVYLPGPYQRAVSPFPVPVEPPTTGPFDNPLQQVCVNVDWLPYIAGALKALWLQSTFTTTDVNDILTMQGKVADLISAFIDVSNGCGAITPGILCLSGTFADLDYGYTFETGLVCDTPYVPGTGWQSCTDPSTGQQLLNINRQFSSEFLLTSFEFRFNKNILSAPYDILMSWIHEGTVVRTDTQSGINGAFTISDIGLSVIVDAVEINAHTNVSDGDLITADDWKLCYVGAFPLSTPNATFEHTFDFTVSDGTWSALSHPSFPDTGIWQNNRWESEVFNDGFGNIEQILIIGKTFTRTHITQVEITWFATSVANGGFRELEGFLSASQVSFLALDGGSGSFVETYIPNTDLDELHAVPTTHNSGGSGNINYITKIVVRGVGSDPF